MVVGRESGVMRGYIKYLMNFLPDKMYLNLLYRYVRGVD